MLGSFVSYSSLDKGNDQYNDVMTKMKLNIGLESLTCVLSIWRLSERWKNFLPVVQSSTVADAIAKTATQILEAILILNVIFSYIIDVFETEYKNTQTSWVWKRSKDEKILSLIALLEYK